VLFYNTCYSMFKMLVLATAKKKKKKNKSQTAASGANLIDINSNGTSAAPAISLGNVSSKCSCFSLYHEGCCS